MKGMGKLMKLIMYSVRDAEKPYIEAWEKKTGNDVKMVTEPLMLIQLSLQRDMMEFPYSKQQNLGMNNCMSN